jgi:hypothetical protein
MAQTVRRRGGAGGKDDGGMGAGATPGKPVYEGGEVTPASGASTAQRDWLDTNERFIPWLVLAFSALIRFYRLEEPPGAFPLRSLSRGPVGVPRLLRARAQGALVPSRVPDHC